MYMYVKFQVPTMHTYIVFSLRAPRLVLLDCHTATLQLGHAHLAILASLGTTVAVARVRITHVNNG